MGSRNGSAVAQSTAFAAAALALAALAPGCVGTPARPPGEATALDAYLAAPDPAYAWTRASTERGDGWTAHRLDLTSLQWRSPAEVEPSTWHHRLTVIVPDRVEGEIGMLYLTGGRNDRPPREDVDSLRLRLALATSTVVAELRTVPNQPLHFVDTTLSVREDDLIAYGWVRFLRERGDPTWIPHLPMTKAAVRAMDAVTEFCASREGGRHAVREFVVAGRSKRGWTSWLAAASDRRVVAVVPMVIDLLNLERSFEHHWCCYGEWSPAIDAYAERGIPDWLGTEEMRALREIIDPYELRERLTLPKLMINGAGDEFFPPDSSRFYFEDLPGEKYLRYLPEAGHAIGDSDFADTLLAFYRSIVRRAERPRLSWTEEPDGSIDVRVDGERQPARVRLLQATNPSARDFRLSAIGRSWTASPLVAESPGRWVARVDPPAAGWTAFFVELTFPAGGPEPFVLTTGVRVLPETLPHGPRPRVR